MLGLLALGLSAPGQNTSASKKSAAAKSSAAGSSKSKKKSAAKIAAAKQTSTAKKKAAGKTASAAKGKTGSAKSARDVAATAQSRRLATAFTATAELRPMAQQLAQSRTAQAYAGVQAYARAHPGDGAMAAYLALGHAQMEDHRYDEAAASFRQASASADPLSDYADYLGAQAALGAGRPADTFALLDKFAERHPGSIFAATAPVLLANAFLKQNNAGGALAALLPEAQTPEASHSDYEYALARAYQLQGNAGAAAPLYRRIYLTQPMSTEADNARAQLQAMNVPLTAAERKSHADQMFDAKHYGEAAQEYQALQRDEAGLSAQDRAEMQIYEAVCNLKLKKLARKDVDRLPETNDDSAALKLYLTSELDRNAGDQAGHDAAVTQMVQHFPRSRWLEEALYSGGNMYLLKRQYEQAIHDYTLLVTMFAHSQYAPSAHWRAAWMNYRLRRYPEAARLMDEQVVQYTAGVEVPAALYWRGRIYEDEEHNFGQALNYYGTISTSYPNYYYAMLARQRISVLSHGNQASSSPSPVLEHVPPPHTADLIESLPENDVHLIKARLLANASLNEYIGPEIEASPTASEWGALAQAEIYSSYGEVTRALQSMKHSGISFFALPVSKVPMTYWQLYFPRPYWNEMAADAQNNGLDPYLVASLIRQESEFNAGAVSKANAYGLMQLIPSTARGAARKEGIKKFSTGMLLQPSTNLQLGTENLKAVLDRFGGQVEYALAAYNAGDVPVRQWLQAGDYKDVPEFVESIPYSETHDYVEAILRNREMYRAVYAGR